MHLHLATISVRSHFANVKLSWHSSDEKKSSSAPPSPVIKYNGHRKSGVDGIGAAVFSRWDVNLFPSSGERRTADNLVWKPEYNTT